MPGPALGEEAAPGRSDGERPRLSVFCSRSAWSQTSQRSPQWQRPPNALLKGVSMRSCSVPVHEAYTKASSPSASLGPPSNVCPKRTRGHTHVLRPAPQGHSDGRAGVRRPEASPHMCTCTHHTYNTHMHIDACAHMSMHMCIYKHTYTCTHTLFMELKIPKELKS